MTKHVLVLGTPRSGTSLTANILNELGYHADFGYSDIFNERGYWENSSLAQINGLILGLFGGGLRHPIPLAENWQFSRLIRRLEPYAIKLIREMNRFDKWTLKDAQLSLTLPFWKKYLPSDTKYIICTRHPLEVASSLARTTGSSMSIQLGLGIWTDYTISALKNTEAESRLFVFYDEYFGSKKQLTKIADFLRLEVTTQNATTVPQEELRHFSSGLNKLNETKLEEKAVKLYKNLVSPSPNYCLDRDSWIDVSFPPRYRLYIMTRTRFALAMGLDLARWIRGNNLSSEIFNSFEKLFIPPKHDLSIPNQKVSEHKK